MVSEIEKLSTITLTNEKGEGKVIYTSLGEFVLLDEKKDKNDDKTSNKLF